MPVPSKEEAKSMGYNSKHEREVLAEFLNAYRDTVRRSSLAEGYFLAAFDGYQVSVLRDEKNASLLEVIVKFGDREFKTKFEYLVLDVDELVGAVLPAQVSLIREQMRVASAAALRGVDSEVAAEDQAAMAGAIGGVREIG